MANITEIVESIKGLSALELVELRDTLQEVFGVSAAAPVMMAGPGTGEAAPTAAAEEKTEFDVVLASAGDKKIQVIKVVREITGLGLKEAKELVDSAPKAIKEKTGKEDAENVKKLLEAEGASVEIK